MIQYIYFVKCPNCEDEPFDFFEEAKAYALGCLSAKPIITQVEVNRDDFGCCTDSCDLGTVWSWETMMSDVPDITSDLLTFSKDDIQSAYDADQDPEFLVLDDSFKTEALEMTADELMSKHGTTDIDLINAGKPEEERVALKADRLPIPEGMTIKDLVEAMEENEDMVECTWCEDLFEKSECRYEVNLGWLCDRCQAAIMSRGEPLTFRENNYWDFLDEDISEDAAESETEFYTPAELVGEVLETTIKSSKRELNPITLTDFIREVANNVEKKFNFKHCSERNLYAKQANWPSDWYGSLYPEAGKQLRNYYKSTFNPKDANKFYNQPFYIEYEQMEINYSKQLDVDVFDEWTEREDYSFKTDVSTIVDYLLEHLTPEDLKQVGFDGSVDDLLELPEEDIDTILCTNFDIFYDIHEKDIIKYFEADAYEQANSSW